MQIEFVGAVGNADRPMPPPRPPRLGIFTANCVGLYVCHIEHITSNETHTYIYGVRKKAHTADCSSMYVPYDKLKLT